MKLVLLIPSINKNPLTEKICFSCQIPAFQIGSQNYGPVWLAAAHATARHRFAAVVVAAKSSAAA
jgi:hypothetical protein